MLHLLADENFNREIIRVLLRLSNNADKLIAQEDGLKGLPDPELLEWAAHRTISF